ncbi:hypothetical protein LZ318_38085 [Saccharopolyspora indica]|uniref:hypothetical protein n=1 Tax=Saccharopolyspora indica TaxID=1229659 RepID=UPI0022EA8D59|nr:hypothetical protein [Saccharopolyspora indica]MDA3642831.1 hypothetical protein [Saccharopolyspora indica]
MSAGEQQRQAAGTLAAPKDFNAAKRLVQRGARVRVVSSIGEPAQLPKNPELITGSFKTVKQPVLTGLLLIVISALAVRLVTVNAWDDEDFFPWYWNVLWTVFPWVFLAPAWKDYFDRTVRSFTASRFADAYEAFRAEAVQVRGTVAGIRGKPTRYRRVSRLVVDVACEWPPGNRMSVVALSPGINLPHHEVPEIGAPAFVWIGPDERTRVAQIPARGT